VETRLHIEIEETLGKMRLVAVDDLAAQ